MRFSKVSRRASKIAALISAGQTNLLTFHGLGGGGEISINKYSFNLDVEQAQAVETLN